MINKIQKSYKSFALNQVRFRGHSLRVDPWLGIVLICFALLAWASWGRLLSPIVDFGREVEISARLAVGQLLYRDVETYYGPLAYYSNALALRLFGHRLEVLNIVGLVLALSATLLFYRLAKRLTNAPWATLCTGCMLLYCAFGSSLFNFIMPYSYGGAYGMVFCLVAINFLDCYLSKGRLGWLVAAAIACGLAGLAKQEYGVAALGGVLVGANLYSPQLLKTRVAHSTLVLIVVGSITFLPLALLAQQISWVKLSSSLIPISQFSYLKQSSIFQPIAAKTFRYWTATFRSFFAGSLAIWVSIVAARQISKLRRFPISREVRIFVEILVGVALAWISLSVLRWFCQFVPGFTFLYTIAGIAYHPLADLSWFLPVLVGWFVIARPQLPRYKHAPLLWALLAISLLLNSRWLFVINFYGLYAAPVILLFFTLLYYWTRRINRATLHYLLICLLIAGGLKLNELEQYRYPVNSSYGTFYTAHASIARAFNQTINTIQASGASSVLILPEGNLLNFLTATHSPSREITFLPPVLPTERDEQEFVAAMQANPPDLIVYVSRSFPEWGYKTYAEFDPLVDSWITKQHRLLASFPMDEGAIRIYTQKVK